MFELVFGIFWTLFSLFMFFIVLFSKAGMSAVLFLVFFIAIGVFLIVKGLTKVVRNYKTSKNGEECFGIIKNVYESGTYINDSAEYKADVIVYIESLGKVEIISEVIGFNLSKFPVGSYVKLKYYNGDINILDVVDYNSISENSKYYLKNEESNIEKVEDIITVNGVKYKKMD